VNYLVEQLHYFSRATQSCREGNMRLKKMTMAFVFPLLLPAFLLQAGVPSLAVGQDDLLARLQPTNVDIHSIPFADARNPSLQTGNEIILAEGGNDSQVSFQGNKQHSRKWVKWVCIGAGIATLVVVGIAGWGYSIGVRGGIH
jgi:hypothetical protein